MIVQNIKTNIEGNFQIFSAEIVFDHFIPQQKYHPWIERFLHFLRISKHKIWFKIPKEYGNP
ncbi:MAG TPA: hypothetical protein PLS49_08435, partial [Candidatus Woesebacteria bacterium]|nr:hypothetical protein [Candidatus Woesebacteria bacterium]